MQNFGTQGKEHWELNKNSPIFKHLMKCNFYQYYFNLLDDDNGNVNLRREIETLLTFIYRHSHSLTYFYCSFC